MGRPRGFDEQAVTAAAAALFAARAYDGLSVDDLVQQLGVHRNSLYKTFGSKRGLYLAALRWYLAHELKEFVARLSGCVDMAQALAVVRQGGGLDLLLLAAVERAPMDAEVAILVAGALESLDEALSRVPSTLSDSRPDAVSAVLGERLRSRASMPRLPMS